MFGRLKSKFKKVFASNFTGRVSVSVAALPHWQQGAEGGAARHRGRSCNDAQIRCRPPLEGGLAVGIADDDSEEDVLAL